ncbi:spore protein [Cohnella soli]|uniref:Spore protein n=1 Tax=Cohnella soli TaxID=425005 RepID=A0ABW0HWD2_9BACL
MTSAQGPSKSGRDNAQNNRKKEPPTAPGFDKKLDGPNRPST